MHFVLAIVVVAVAVESTATSSKPSKSAIEAVVAVVAVVVAMENCQTTTTMVLLMMTTTIGFVELLVEVIDCLKISASELFEAIEIWSLFGHHQFDAAVADDVAIVMKPLLPIQVVL